MNEALRARVLTRTRRDEAGMTLVTVNCRAATLTGNAVDFSFTLGAGDPRLVALRPGNRVLYSTQGAKSLWGVATVPGMSGPPIPVDTFTVHKAGDGYGDALGFEARPPEHVMESVQAEGARMGFTVSFGTDEAAKQPYVEVHVPGRGKMRHYKDLAATWDEVLAAAGLGGTL